MIAVDTNILVHAHRSESPFHREARKAIASLAEGSAAWAIPWPCVHEFLAVTTNPRALKPPTPVSLALDQIEALMEAPTLRLLAEPFDYWDRLRAVMEGAGVKGPVTHDARIYAICLASGVQTLWTADRDFGRFRGLRLVNPLKAAAS